MTRNGCLRRLAVLLLAAVLPATAGVKSDWSRVRAVEAGRLTTVLLYADEAPAGAGKLQGRFESAAAESITLALPDGLTRTIEKRAVRKVLVRRPLAKRWPGWAALGISAGLWQTLVILMQDMKPGAVALTGSFIIPPTVVAFFGSQMKGIYNVPPKHREKLRVDKQATGGDAR